MSTIFWVYYYNLTKGYWMRNNLDGGWEKNGNLYNTKKIQYTPAAWREQTPAHDDYLVNMFMHLSYAPPTGRVQHKAFFKVCLGTGPLLRHVRWLPKYLGLRRHSSKKGRLSGQAINLAPPRRVRTWGDSFMKVGLPRQPRQAASSGSLDRVKRGHQRQLTCFSYLPSTSPNGRVRHKAFFSSGFRHRAVDQIRSAAPKMHQVPSAFPEAVIIFAPASQ